MNDKKLASDAILRIEASKLMEVALILLDLTGDTLAAGRLDHAIEALGLRTAPANSKTN
jgi:hypothetical protein